MFVLEFLYTACVTILSLFGVNSLILTLIYWATRGREQARISLSHPLPKVTIQLPVYNESVVLHRLLEATTHLDYPGDRLEIQVLDDSTDDTTELAERLVHSYQSRGWNVVHLHRANRQGYKAGALAAGLSRASGEFLAVFDADFLPPPDFLRCLLPYFANPQVGCVQSRWGHLNSEYSTLTQAQRLMVDGHFMIEQRTRSITGLFMGFNGSAGIWRRQAIENAGGWSGETLTEDLDLSYRAQLAGWRVVFVPEVVTPGELPVQVDALKRQQFRWSKGSIQTVLKLTGPLLRSRQSWWIKAEAILHLTGYLTAPLMLLTVLLVPLIHNTISSLRVLPWLTIGSLGMPFLTVSSQLGQGWRDGLRLRHMPLLFLLQVGLALNNTRAVIEAIAGRPSSFERTPKFGVRSRSDRWQKSPYGLAATRQVWVELGIAMYAFGSAVLVTYAGQWPLAPWLLMYSASFFYVAGLSLRQTLQLDKEMTFMYTVGHADISQS